MGLSIGFPYVGVDPKGIAFIRFTPKDEQDVVFWTKIAHTYPVKYYSALVYERIKEVIRVRFTLLCEMPENKSKMRSHHKASKVIAA